MTADPRRRLSIGELAQITHLSIRQLRRYHDAGLLVPDEVDPFSSYRYYSLAQVPTALSIQRFRDLGLPVAEIRELLTAADAADREAVLGAHLARLEDQLDRTRLAVQALRRILAPEPDLEVTLRHVPATEVVGVRESVDHDTVLDWYDGAAAELAPLRRTGPPGGLYDHELFTRGHGEALVYVPTEDEPPGGRTQRVTLPAREVAVVTHVGPHDDIDVSYAALGTHLAAAAIGAEGPVQEVYLVGPRDDPDPRAWRTELAWPVLRTA